MVGEGGTFGCCWVLVMTYRVVTPPPLPPHPHHPIPPRKLSHALRRNPVTLGQCSQSVNQSVSQQAGDMEEGLLSLKWNNHKSTFFHVLSILREKHTYTDVTLACDGRLYPAHKFVLSTCSEYFSDIFTSTTGNNIVIVLKDVRRQDLEYLLDYMYLGQVDVAQSELSSLIKTAECLRIKGLAIPDDEPQKIPRRGPEERDHDGSPPSKKKRHLAEEERTSSISSNNTACRIPHVALPPQSPQQQALLQRLQVPLPQPPQAPPTSQAAGKSHPSPLPHSLAPSQVPRTSQVPTSPHATTSTPQPHPLLSSPTQSASLPVIKQEVADPPETPEVFMNESYDETETKPDVSDSRHMEQDVAIAGPSGLQGSSDNWDGDNDLASFAGGEGYSEGGIEEQGDSEVQGDWNTTDEIEVKEEEISDGMENEMIFARKLETSLTDTSRPKSRKTEEKYENKNQTSKSEFISKDQTALTMKEKGLGEITKGEKQGRSIVTMKVGTRRKISGVSGKMLCFSSSRLSNENCSNQRPCTSKGTSVFDKTPEKENSQRNMPITEHHSFVKQISSIEKIVPVTVQTHTGIASLSSNGRSSTNQENSSANSETPSPLCDPFSSDDYSFTAFRLLPSGSPNNPKVFGKCVSKRQTPLEYDGQTEINKLNSASSIDSTCDKATKQDELFGVKQVGKMPVMKSKDGNFLIPNHGGSTSVHHIEPSHSDFVDLEPVGSKTMLVNTSALEKFTQTRNNEIDVEFALCPSSLVTVLQDDILIPHLPTSFEEICEKPNYKSISSQGKKRSFLGSFEYVHPLTVLNMMKVDKYSKKFTGPWRFSEDSP
ncbi:uncharacterized protein [Panulirus ornatus]|uniref:uncharacterized protein isoform X4 n=1 Tax=Panulirus ornatus TaxID=150431 RepID=UPI003A83B89D